MSLVSGLGPLEENVATEGAISSLYSMLFNIVAVGSLSKIYTKNATQLMPS